MFVRVETVFVARFKPLPWNALNMRLSHIAYPIERFLSIESTEFGRRERKTTAKNHQIETMEMINLHG